MKAKQILPALGLSLLLTAPALVAQPTTQTQKCCSQCSQCTHKTDLSQLPRTIFSGVRGPFHVQGIAVDLKRGYIYFSFTTELLKTDLKGNLIGSVKGLTGHLGCLTMNPEDGRVYGSIEYKNDAIGREILQKLDNSEQLHNTNAFYIAIFDVDKITRPDMDAEKDSVMTTVYLKEVVDDFYATVQNGGRTVEHRHGCSGVDGISFGPAFGAPKGSKNYLNIAYGVFEDTLRTDNDYQVLLNFDPAKLKPYERTLNQENPHRSGPDSCDQKYFVRTGNTAYGIQNLAYDPYTGDWFAAVYRGHKHQNPNYSLFAIDGSKAPVMQQLEGFDTPTRGELLTLSEQGECDAKTGIRGWQVDYGTTGFCPLGCGYYYISHPDGGEGGKHQSSMVKLYKWTGDPKHPFELVK